MEANHPSSVRQFGGGVGIIYRRCAYGRCAKPLKEIDLKGLN